MPMSITLAIQYILSKAVLKQAEVEVTAKPSTAFPLARIMVRLIERNPGLGSIFMAKLVQMTGSWVVGVGIAREAVSILSFCVLETGFTKGVYCRVKQKQSTGNPSAKNHPQPKRHPRNTSTASSDS